MEALKTFWFGRGRYHPQVENENMCWLKISFTYLFRNLAMPNPKIRTE